MAIDVIGQDDGVQVSHTRCVECGEEAILTMHNPDKFGDKPAYQPLLIPEEDVCGVCIDAEWDRIKAEAPKCAQCAEPLLGIDAEPGLLCFRCDAKGER